MQEEQRRDLCELNTSNGRVILLSRGNATWESGSGAMLLGGVIPGERVKIRPDKAWDTIKGVSLHIRFYLSWSGYLKK